MGVRDKLLAFNDRRTSEVYVDAWKETLEIQELNLDESMKLAQMYGDGESATLRAEDIASVVSWGVVDKGQRVFADDDIPALAQKSRAALVQLFEEITKLSASPEEASGN
jgi:predicted naringenin-chalcone synthase